VVGARGDVCVEGWLLLVSRHHASHASPSLSGSRALGSRGSTVVASECFRPCQSRETKGARPVPVVVVHSVVSMLSVLFEREGRPEGLSDLMVGSLLPPPVALAYGVGPLLPPAALGYFTPLAFVCAKKDEAPC
jgi:hypothetical protein